MEKQFGVLDTAQAEKLAATVAQIFNGLTTLRDELQSPGAERENFERRLLFPWSFWYEIPFSSLVAILFWSYDQTQLLSGLASSPDPQEAALDMLPEFQALGHEKSRIRIPFDYSEFGVSKRQFEDAWALSLSMATALNFEATALYGESLYDLLRKVESGDVERLFEAILIDPSVVSAPTVEVVLARAVGMGDKEFLGKLAKAVTGTRPRRPKDEHRGMRYLVTAIYRSGRDVAATYQDVRDLILDGLSVYETKGDPDQALKKATQRLFKRWGT